MRKCALVARLSHSVAQNKTLLLSICGTARIRIAAANKEVRKGDLT